MIKEIITWAIIIIVGSIIFSYVFAPDTFYDTKERIGNWFKSKSSNHPNQEIVSINSYMFCADYEFNKFMCQQTCGMEGFEYQRNKCVNGELICQCRK